MLQGELHGVGGSICLGIAVDCNLCTRTSPNVFVFLCVFLCVEFRTGKSPILIATDVASRGLGML